MHNTRNFPYLHTHDEYFGNNGMKLDFRKNQVFVRPDDPVSWVFFLKKGLVKISFFLNDGDERLIGYLIPGMTFAQNRSFFEGDGGGLEYSTVTPCSIYKIERDDFFNQLKTNQAFNEDYLRSLLRNQTYLIDRVLYQGESNIYAKCLRWLLFMAKFYGTEKNDAIHIGVPMTQEVIGNFLHASRESVSKCLKDLTSHGLIEINKKQITILNIKSIELQLAPTA